MKHWSAAFVGLTWAERGRSRDGLDCWGLVRLVYGEALGIDLPSYTGAYACVSERAEIAEAIAKDSGRWPWTAVTPSSERAFDVATFQRGGLQCHVGIVIERGRMLHISVGGQSCVEDYLNGRWKPRLIGFSRHAEVKSCVT